jgi:hypothetical protein
MNAPWLRCRVSDTKRPGCLSLEKRHDLLATQVRAVPGTHRGDTVLLDPKCRDHIVAAPLALK